MEGELVGTLGLVVPQSVDRALVHHTQLLLHTCSPTVQRGKRGEEVWKKEDREYEEERRGGALVAQQVVYLWASSRKVLEDILGYVDTR